MQASSDKRPKLCFLEHQLLKPMAALVMLSLLGLLVWGVIGHADGASAKVEFLSASRKPFLGVRLVAPDELVARMFSFPPGEAVLIDHIVANSPADHAGLRRGDGILAVNGRPIRTTDDISAYLDQAKGGDLLSLTVIRGGLVRDLMLPVESGLAP